MGRRNEADGVVEARMVSQVRRLYSGVRRRHIERARAHGRRGEV